MNDGTIKFVGLSNRRTIELSDYRTVGTIEPSDYQSDPVKSDSVESFKSAVSLIIH
jgi:hypothetical protein